MAIKVITAAGAISRAENRRGPVRHPCALRREGHLPLLIRDGIPDDEGPVFPTEEDTAVSGIQRDRATLGMMRAEGGRGHEVRHADELSVAEHPHHRRGAVELAEAAAKAGAGDEAAPALANERGAEEARRFAWREAEEDLLDELLG